MANATEQMIDAALLDYAEANHTSPAAIRLNPADAVAFFAGERREAQFTFHLPEAARKVKDAGEAVAVGLRLTHYVNKATGGDTVNVIHDDTVPAGTVTTEA